MFGSRHHGASLDSHSFTLGSCPCQPREKPARSAPSVPRRLIASKCGARIPSLDRTSAVKPRVCHNLRTNRLPKKYRRTSSLAIAGLKPTSTDPSKPTRRYSSTSAAAPSKLCSLMQATPPRLGLGKTGTNWPPCSGSYLRSVGVSHLNHSVRSTPRILAGAVGKSTKVDHISAGTRTKSESEVVARVARPLV